MRLLVLWVVLVAVVGCGSKPPRKTMSEAEQLQIMREVVEDRETTRVAKVAEQVRIAQAEAAERRKVAEARAMRIAKRVKTMTEENLIFLSLGRSQGQMQDAAKVVAAYELKDPDGAKFRNVYVRNFPDGPIVCGEINAKNSYGGYNGFEPFAASVNRVERDTDVISEACR